MENISYLTPLFVGIQIFETTDSVRPYQGALFFGSGFDENGDAFGTTVAIQKCGTDVDDLIRDIASWARQSFDKIHDSVIVFFLANHMIKSLKAVESQQSQSGMDQPNKQQDNELLERLRRNELFVAKSTTTVH